MGVSKNNGKTPQIIHYKPSILGAHPYFWKHPIWITILIPTYLGTAFAFAGFEWLRSLPSKLQLLRAFCFPPNIPTQVEHPEFERGSVQHVYNSTSYIPTPLQTQANISSDLWMAILDAQVVTRADTSNVLESTKSGRPRRKGWIVILGQFPRSLCRKQWYLKLGPGAILGYNGWMNPIELKLSSPKKINFWKKHDSKMQRNRNGHSSKIENHCPTIADSRSLCLGLEGWAQGSRIRRLHQQNYNQDHLRNNLPSNRQCQKHFNLWDCRTFWFGCFCGWKCYKGSPAISRGRPLHLQVHEV